MEKQEKAKKIKVCKRERRGSKSSSSSLPLDLVSEILLRLPEKSVVRFRCVSKAWSSIITTDPYFINLFKARSPRLLICFKADDKLVVSSMLQHHQIFETSSNKLSWSYSSSFEPIDCHPVEFPIYSTFSPTESVQGLICFKKSGAPVVLNPSTRQKIILPKPCKSWPSKGWSDFTILLGYDPVESKHKVMCFGRNSDECRVLTLGSAQEESWRTVKTSLNFKSRHATSGRCIKGVVYYIADVDLGPTTTITYVLVSFDVRSEKFDKIQLPPSPSEEDDYVHNNYELIAYQGRLACFDKTLSKKIRLWILEEDAEKHKYWSSKDFPTPASSIFQLIGFTHNGELIFRKGQSWLLFYDPVRNSYRRFGLRGITNYKSVPNNHDCHPGLIHVIPNHVESRVFL